jgi:PAS domain S-box-containing protein
MKMISQKPSAHIAPFLIQIKNRSDLLMNYFLVGYFGVGLFLAFYYDTWLIGVGVGGLSLLAYYSAKTALPGSNFYQYVLSVVMGLFMAQFIYQMHGMFEMHFWAFIGSAILICYQNWKLQIPLALVVIVHHGAFGYLQYSGVKEVYFTQLEYMTMETFIIHGILATSVFFLCGLWAYIFQTFSNSHIQQSFELGKLQEKDAVFAERKIAEDTIRKSESNLRAIFDNTEVAFILLDGGARVISFNKVAGNFAREILKKELRAGEKYIDLVPADRKDFAEKTIEQVSRGEQVSYEVSYGTDDVVQWLQINLQPVLNDGQIIGSSVALTNITERKLVAQTLEKQNTELLKANAELDRFVYSASHELRSPLVSILGLITLVKEKESDGELMNYLSMMETNVTRLDVFIRDIVNYSRNSRLDLEKDRIDFKQVIYESVEQLQFMKQVEKIRIATRISGGNDFYSDKKRISVIMNNFLSNAIKYHNFIQADPYISITVDMDKEKAQLRIEDNGHGISPKYKDKIFNMFFRANIEQSGTGLGLYIVKEIVDKMGGSVHVDSEEGKGTTFYVELPNYTQS